MMTAPSLQHRSQPAEVCQHIWQFKYRVRHSVRNGEPVETYYCPFCLAQCSLTDEQTNDRRVLPSTANALPIGRVLTDGDEPLVALPDWFSERYMVVADPKKDLLSIGRRSDGVTVGEVYGGDWQYHWTYYPDYPQGQSPVRVHSSTVASGAGYPTRKRALRELITRLGEGRAAGDRD